VAASDNELSSRKHVLIKKYLKNRKKQTRLYEVSVTIYTGFLLTVSSEDFPSACEKWFLSYIFYLFRKQKRKKRNLYIYMKGIISGWLD
jgi:hypothetical protein